MYLHIYIYKNIIKMGTPLKSYKYDAYSLKIDNLKN